MSIILKRYRGTFWLVLLVVAGCNDAPVPPRSQGVSREQWQDAKEGYVAALADEVPPGRGWSKLDAAGPDRAWAEVPRPRDKAAMAGLAAARPQLRLADERGQPFLEGIVALDDGEALDFFRQSVTVRIMDVLYAPPPGVIDGLINLTIAAAGYVNSGDFAGLSSDSDLAERWKGIPRSARLSTLSAIPGESDAWLALERVERPEHANFSSTGWSIRKVGQGYLTGSVQVVYISNNRSAWEMKTNAVYDPERKAWALKSIRLKPFVDDEIDWSRFTVPPSQQELEKLQEEIDAKEDRREHVISFLNDATPSFWRNGESH